MDIGFKLILYAILYRDIRNASVNILVNKAEKAAMIRIRDRHQFAIMGPCQFSSQ